MKTINRSLLPILRSESPPLNFQYGWMDSLTTDVTEDFIAVEKIGEDFNVRIKIYVAKNIDITSVNLFFIKCGDEIRTPLIKLCHASQDVWVVSFNIVSEVMLNPLSYRFKIDVGAESFFWDAKGTYKYQVDNSTNFKFYYNHSAPQWIESAVVYHIFIDRFKKSLSPKEGEISWGRAPTDNAHEFYGGDLVGIMDKLDYLVGLGVNTLCLTPIFKSSTNHRYDVENYYQVDESLGGRHAFELLSSACRERNIKILLDGVFNHVSGRSQWFDRDALYSDEGAYQNINSRYSDYFNFHAHPEQYDAFWGDKYLPKLNYRSLELRKNLYKNEDSIVKHWLTGANAVDGWRLDACCMIGKYENSNVNSEVLEELYAAAKSSNSDCYIFGENPFDPSEISQYKHMDGLTNYSGFYTPLIYWLDKNVNFNVSDFDAALKEFRALLGYQFTLSCKTFFGNHDKPRLYGVIGCDIEKYFTALAFLFTYPGVPTIYYGEEIGLHDLNSQNDSRICMQWDFKGEDNKKIFDYTKSLIDLYRFSRAIQKGCFLTIYAEKDIFIYERFSDDDYILVVLNNSTTASRSIVFESNSIARLALDKLYSYLDCSLEVSVFMERFVEIKNITSKSPIVLSSKNYSS